MNVLLPTPAAPPSDAVDGLHAFADARSWRLGVSVLLATTQVRVRAYRVSLAWCHASGVGLVAWSDAVPLEEGVGVNELEAACIEATRWPHANAWPACAGQDLAAGDMPAHLALFKSQGLTAVVSVPLRDHRGQVVGVLSCERIPQASCSGGGAAMPDRPEPAQIAQIAQIAETGFSLTDVQWLQALAELVGPVLAMRHQLEQPWYLRSWSWLAALGTRLSDPTERWLRWSVLGFFGLSAFMVGWPMPYTLAVPARLEPQVQTAVVAPAQAVVMTTRVKPGDVVQAGQTLASLSVAPSQLSRSDLGERLLRVEALIQAAQQSGVAAALSRWRTVRKDLQHELDALQGVELLTEVRAPFDGVIVRQADAGAAGSHVQRGEAMWVLSPGLDWRAVLEVDESDVAGLQPGQQATLRLSSEPDRGVKLALKRAVPVAVADDGALHFDMDAQAVGGSSAGLRPGLRGVAHIDMPPRPLLWRAVEALRNWWLLTVWELW